MMGTILDATGTSFGIRSCKQREYFYRLLCVGDRDISIFNSKMHGQDLGFD